MMSRINKAVVSVPVDDSNSTDGIPGEVSQLVSGVAVSPIPGYAPMAAHVRIAQTNALTAEELYQQAEKGQLGWP